jgi:sulfoacetaldehyde dehydrogenase
MEPARNEELATMAVEMTGLGNVADKITKNHRKTLGLLRDIRDAKTHGVIEDDTSTGITRIARPIGVIGAVVPSTNPVATPTNNVVNALKCGNAIILSPSPKGVGVCESCSNTSTPSSTRPASTTTWCRWSRHRFPRSRHSG